MKRLLYIISIFYFLQGCRSNYQRVVEVYPNGAAKTIYLYTDKNDTTKYVYQAYYNNGQLMFSSKVVNNKFTEEKINYFENGQIERLENLNHPVSFDDSL